MEKHDDFDKGVKLDNCKDPKEKIEHNRIQKTIGVFISSMSTYFFHAGRHQ